eukprot:SAG22_NODE_438_length_10500_cov_13.037496_10_plen_171_part_00
MNINSDNLCDFTHSYIQAVLTNTSTKALALDTGIPWISRVQILSGGQELENIESYNRLHSMLEAVQGNPNQAGELSLTQNARFPMSDNTSVSAGAITIPSGATEGSLNNSELQTTIAIRVSTTGCGQHKNCSLESTCPIGHSLLCARSRAPRLPTSRQNRYDTTYSPRQT